MVESRGVDSDNFIHAHRHAYKAWVDFCILRNQLPSLYDEHELLHSISHHLRHTVYRTGLEVPREHRHYARRYGK
jgi:hypothetical protein